MAETIPYGAVFYRENTAGGAVFTLVGEVVGITPPAISAGVGDATALDDTAVQSIKGLPDLGECTVRFKYDPNDTGHAALKADVAAAPGTASRTYVLGYVTITGGGTAQYLSMTGPATGWSEDAMEAGNNDPVMAEFTFKVNSIALSSSAPSTS